MRAALASSCILFLCVAGAMAGQTNHLSTTGSFEATLYLPHGEYPANFGLPEAQTIVGRYSLAADVTVRHDECPLFGGLYTFLVLGNATPQNDYSYDPDPILMEVQPTLGWRFIPWLDARVAYNYTIDLGQFTSKHEVNDWLALSIRASTPQPINVFNVVDASGFAELSFYPPRFEFTAVPGESPPGFPDRLFRPSDVVYARYAFEANVRLQPRWKYLKWLFVFDSHRLYFGDVTSGEPDSFGASPISVFIQFGAGIQLTRHLELRIAHHVTESIGGAHVNMDNQLWNGVSVRYVW